MVNWSNQAFCLLSNIIQTVLFEESRQISNQNLRSKGSFICIVKETFPLKRLFSDKFHAKSVLLEESRHQAVAKNLRLISSFTCIVKEKLVQGSAVEVVLRNNKAH